MKAAIAWAQRIGVVVLLVLVVAIGVHQLGEPAGAAEELCAKAKAAKMACKIDDAQLVQTEDGSVFLVIGDKVFQLQ